MARLVFDAVHVDHEIQRLGGDQGHAWANTSYFSAKGRYAVELDTAAGLVYITHEGGGAIVVPRERVKRFEPKADKPAAK